METSQPCVVCGEHVTVPTDTGFVSGAVVLVDLYGDTPAVAVFLHFDCITKARETL